jgi:uncharacterized protein YjcR
MDRQTISKEAITAEYLAGETTYRKLQAKYGCDLRTIHQWCRHSRAKSESEKRLRKMLSRFRLLNRNRYPQK